MAAQIFPYGTALTVVWHLSKPDGTDFDITGYTYRVYYRTGNKETEANGSHVTASGNTISIVIPATEPSAPGEYALRLVLYQNNKLFCTLNYNAAFVLSRRLAQDLAVETQQEEVQVVHLYTVAEFYLFTPIIPTVGTDGYWYVNGTKVTDGQGEFVPSSHTMEYDAQTNYIIIDRNRVDSQGRSIAQTITSLADALSTAAEDHETAQEDHSTAAGDHGTATADHTTATWDHQAIVDMIDLYEPITINGDVTNAADEEDITSDENDLLKFKDRGVIYGMGYCILRRNKTFAEQLTKTNTIYEIRYDFDLSASTFTVPAGSTLYFVGGSIANGTLTGQNTKLVFDGPFVNNAALSGTFYTEQDVKDDGVFRDSTYDTRRISSLFAIQSPSQKVVFSKHTYNDVEAIDVNRNIDVDFGGSTVKMLLDGTGFPSSFLMMEVSDNRSVSANVLDFVKIHNVNIDGNTGYEYDETATFSSSGRYRRAIQLFKVSDVLIENVSLIHYVVGTTNYPDPLPAAGIYRYQNKAIMIWGYDTAEIDGFVSHDCRADNLIGCIPNLNADNMAVVKNCHSYLNFTGLFAILDGRCSVHDNIVENFDSSAFNVFCYDSEIYSNYFADGTRSTAIDLSEDGAYIAYNVSIHDNTCKNVPGGIAGVCGSVINMSNNSASATGVVGAAFYLSMPSLETFVLSDTVNNPFTGNELYDIRVQNNYAYGSDVFLRTGVSSSGMAKMANKKYRDVTICDNIFIGNDNPSLKAGGYISLPPVKQLSIVGNYFDGLAQAILSSSSTSCVSIHYVIYNSTSGTTIAWTSASIHMERNKFASAGVDGGRSKNYVLYLQDLEQRQNCEINIEMFGNVLACERKLLTYSGDRIASGQTFNINEVGNINGVITYDTAVLESNYPGKMKFQSGIPVWWNGTAWVDATGEPVS